MPARRRAEDEPEEDHVSERQTDWMKGAPRWLLLWGLLAAVTLGSAMGGALFNLIMQREAEHKAVQITPAYEGIAALETRMNRFDVRLTVLETQIPQLAQKVDKIDANVERLLRRR